jgi:AraC-like DNA-binding protein
MPAKSISLPGLPLIDDGHQFRVEAATGLGACETAIRLLLIDEASVVVEGRLRGRLDPPVLAVLPPGWNGSLRLARGGFCYRIDLDGGAALAPLLGLDAPLILSGAAIGPWRGEVIALAQRWWLSLDERRRTAIHVAALLERLTADRHAPPPTPGIAGRYQELVRAHLGSNERVDALAARLGVSRATLDRAMTASVGRTAAEWQRGERLREAVVLLDRTVRSVEDIGRSVGFPDPDSFARAFRRQHGCTPKAWRQQRTRR